ncbi:NAD-dependent epimerase/dehydratase family protein [Arenibaculum pallidiluteum]|uniref:NAD-dependent epimerase/dehydratase family protein n=1 Tax=Arenibaculum pallidiluteum TaxID=2812559 RepID=UPI001A9768ED|nr:NAD-dependent epimerase/dehydratase family protein [Arenibaculum pallidiluteum]
MAVIFVTGGAGYLGSHLCAGLWASGHLPVAYDDLSSGKLAAVRWGPLVLGDVGDRERLEEALILYGPDLIVHLAQARSGAAELRRAGEVRAALTLLEAMQARGLRRLVAPGHAAALGVGAPGREPDPAAETIVEQMLRDADRGHGLHSVLLRLPRIAGRWAGAAAPPAVDPDGQGRDAGAGRCLDVAEAVAAMVTAVNYLLQGGASATLDLGPDAAGLGELLPGWQTHAGAETLLDPTWHGVVEPAWADSSRPGLPHAARNAA